MDLQRNILIVGLLVVSYLMFVTWQNDFAEGAPATTQNAAPAAAATTPTEPAPANAGDLAGLAPAGSAAPAATVSDTPVAAASRSVVVRTDLVEATINLDGGDLVGLTLTDYPLSPKVPGEPVRLMSTGNVTYVAQSGLVSAQGPDLPTGQRAAYTADAARYELADGAATLEVVLRAPENSGIAIDKVYRFSRGDYLVNITYRVRNNGTTPWAGFLFGQLKRDGSGDPSHPGGGSFISASPTYLGGAYASNEAIYNKATFDDVIETPLKMDVKGGWIAFIQHYFVSAWVPSADTLNHFFTRQGADGNFLFGFSSPQVSVAPGTTQDIGASFYAGPKLQDRLDDISPGLDLTVDYGWFWFISQPLLLLLVWIEKLFGNWGVAIILLTVCVKVLFYYPSQISYRSMAHMRRVTPELTRIREEYKNDRQKQSQEMLALYKKEKINPLGGCLPILLQMPVFIALYWVLLESVELRQAPFMLWITDLSAKDPYFVLPILMGISMWVQTKLNPAPPDPMQAKMMQWLPWIFTVFFLFFASGLVLYWLVNNVLSIAQQWYITRQIEKEHAKA